VLINPRNQPGLNGLINSPFWEIMEKHLDELKDTKVKELQVSGDTQKIFQAQGYLLLLQDFQSLRDIIKNQETSK
jgi:hypothetical protein